MTTLEAQFASANSQEDPELSKSLATPVLEAAERNGDSLLQARALALIAQCENLLGNRRSACALSTRAAQLFQSLGNLGEEAAALSFLSRASSALDRNEAAVEAALLGLELAKRADSPQAAASAHSQLGFALAQSRSFEAAMESLVRSRTLAQECGSELDDLVALVTQGMCETFRVVTLRHEMGLTPPLGQVQDLLHQFEGFVAEHDMVALAQPDQMSSQVLLQLISGLFHCWCGDVDRARCEMQRARDWLDKTGAAPWLETFEVLVRCEFALVEQDFSHAELQARRLVEIGDATEHEQAALLGHLLACRVLELQGRHAEALAELRALSVRERRIRCESLSTRHEVVTWQLDMRTSEQSRQSLLASTAHLEKLSLEDALTGIANRRCFEAAAAEGLRQCGESGKSLCIAMLDVDHFKQVNDRHSHVVGDKVLQVIAELLTAHVRKEDLAARLAGDEFIILFRQTDARSAWDACERLRTAVSAYDWTAISSGLAVSVSIGLAEAAPGDSLEALLRRSDGSMYDLKNATRALL